MRTLLLTAVSTAALLSSRAHGQASCTGKPLAGTVTDSTAALVPGAEIRLDGRTAGKSGSNGSFRIACVGAGPHHLAAIAQGFAQFELDLPASRGEELKLVLFPSTSAEVTVNADAQENMEMLGGVNGMTIPQSKLQTLADDPDDLLRELQQMAAAAGGNPSGTIISVDGFQGDSPLPPKSSIAFIKVNPDTYSAEYRQPPNDGGRIEIYTKPGATTFHGALFTTNSSQWMNARDPFSLSSAPIGKQRYGFEFNGPVRKQGSNFSATLEHRSINNFAVVDAITLDSTGNLTSTNANVATPQLLWLGTARVDWQLGAKNMAFVSYSANVNHLSNVGVGGTSLAETGYDSGTYDHTLRISNVTTLSPRLLHESRVSLDWRGETDTPASSTPQVQVSGSFTGGGASIGPQRIRELRTEWDDDIILTSKAHNFKAGLQLFTFGEQRALTTNFNGTYIFGGGPAPVLDSNNNPTRATTEISGIEQYRRSMLGLAGGTPTQFSGATGTPQVDFTSMQFVLFAQDDWKLRPNLSVALGLRYFLQSDPTELNNFNPRLGVTWTPSWDNKLSLNAHVGTFSAHSGNYGANAWAEILREDGVHRITSLVYNPVYGNPYSAGATIIHAERSVSPSFVSPVALDFSVGGRIDLTHGWSFSTNSTGLIQWRDGRTVNINTPLNGQPTGPRPLAPNLNIYQFVSNGRGFGDIEFAGISQQKLKWMQFFFGAVHVNIREDADDNALFSPQSSLTDHGEYAHRTGQSTWQTFGNGTFNLPQKLQLSWNLYADGDAAYNITTGFDNNGDGDFNDRPQFATSPTQAGAVQTSYGLLVPSGGTGVLSRNLGRQPWHFYLDGNIQRAFQLTRNAKADHQQTITLNVRSSNLLNHTNVTGIGGVLGSPLFGIGYTADPGRRFEGGARYSF